VKTSSCLTCAVLLPTSEHRMLTLDFAVVNCCCVGSRRRPTASSAREHRGPRGCRASLYAAIEWRHLHRTSRPRLYVVIKRIERNKIVIRLASVCLSVRAFVSACVRECIPGVTVDCVGCKTTNGIKLIMVRRYRSTCRFIRTIQTVT
jgi:hypothetical protein